MQIALKNSLVDDLNSTDLLLYSYMQVVAKGSCFDNTYVSCSTASKQLGIYERTLKKSYDKLKQLNIISDADHINKATFNVKGSFTIIEDFEFISIATKCPNAYKYFILLIRSLDFRHEVYANGITRSSVVGHMPVSFFCDALSCSRNTISNYNADLKDAGVLYMVVSKYCENNQHTNVYGRSRDKPFIDKYAGQEWSFDDAGYFRRMTVKYTWLCKGKEYSAEEIEEIKQFCIKYNKTAAKPKDMSIFKKECD